MDLVTIELYLGLLLTISNYVIVFLLVPRILLDPERESGATLAWVFFILLVPCIGLLGFHLLGTRRLRMRLRKRRRVEETLAGSLERLMARQRGLLAPFPIPPELLHLTRSLHAAPPLPGNAVALYRHGPSTFCALEKAIDAAREHVHLVYYIWKPDRTGTRMLEALTRAAARGVEVRLLVDDVGSASASPRFFRPLEAAGGKVARFLPVSLLSRRWTLNNRNHRKLVVVDGWVGFTGGMNVGDEYAGLGPPWRDAHVRVAGPAVVRLQEVFCQDWYHATGEDLAREDYFPEVEPLGDVWAQFLASGPADAGWQAIYTFMFAAITQAHQRVWIETPYFVPDPSFGQALRTAALRGVDVQLLLPQSSDHPLVLHAGRSFYDDLLEAGVQIWELPHAFLHSKTMIIDDVVASVGSTNIDQRSFRLNFEANAFFYGPAFCKTLARSFLAIRGDARRVTPELRARRGWSARVLEAIGRVLAPVL